MSQPGTDLEALVELSRRLSATSWSCHRSAAGVVLYTGRQALPFGAGLHALPISALWRLDPAKPARR